MDESRLAELKRRIRAHPAFHGGPADETYWLDYMEWILAEYGTYDFKVERLADNLKRHPDQVPAYVVASESDGFAWDVLSRLVTLLWRNERVVPAVLLEWWMDKTTDIRDRPPSGGERRYQMRDLTIVAAVNGIRNVTDLPYEFDEPSGREPRTACHVVAERLGWTYERVRSIWRNNKSIVKRARAHGLVPPARPRTRRNS